MRCWSKSRGRFPWGLLNSIDTHSAFSVGMELFAALVAGLLLIACFLEAGHRHRATLYFMGILAAGAFPSRTPPMRLAPYSAKRWECEDVCIAVLL